MISKNILFSLTLGWPSYLITEIRKFSPVLQQDSMTELINRGLKEQSLPTVRNLSGIMEETNKMEFDKKIRFIRKFLYEKLNISSKDDILTAIRLYQEGSPYSAYLENLFADAENKRICFTNLPGAVLPEGFFHPQLFLHKNVGFMKNPAFKAYDISMLILLLRFSLYLEWINTDKALQILEKTAEEVFQKYISFEEFFTEGAVAYAFFNHEFYVNDLYFQAIREYSSLEETFAEYYIGIHK